MEEEITERKFISLPQNEKLQYCISRYEPSQVTYGTGDVIYDKYYKPHDHDYLILIGKVENKLTELKSELDTIFEKLEKFTFTEEQVNTLKSNIKDIGLDEYIKDNKRRYERNRVLRLEKIKDYNEYIKQNKIKRGNLDKMKNEVKGNGLLNNLKINVIEDIYFPNISEMGINFEDLIENTKNGLILKLGNNKTEYEQIMQKN